MKKNILIVTALLLLITLVSLAGCTVITTPSGNQTSEDNTSTVTTYDNVSEDQLEAELTKYREIASSLASEVEIGRASCRERV